MLQTIKHPGGVGRQDEKGRAVEENGLNTHLDLGSDEGNGEAANLPGMIEFEEASTATPAYVKKYGSKLRSLSMRIPRMTCIRTRSSCCKNEAAPKPRMAVLPLA